MFRMNFCAAVFAAVAGCSRGDDPVPHSSPVPSGSDAILMAALRQEADDLRSQTAARASDISMTAEKATRELSKCQKECADLQAANASLRQTIAEFPAFPRHDLRIKAWRKVNELTFDNMDLGMFGPFSKKITAFRIEDVATPQYGLIVSALASGERRLFALKMPVKNLPTGIIGDSLPGVYRVVQQFRLGDRIASVLEPCGEIDARVETPSRPANDDPASAPESPGATAELSFGAMRLGTVGPFAKAAHGFRIERIMRSDTALISFAEAGEKHFFLLRKNTRDLIVGPAPLSVLGGKFKVLGTARLPGGRHDLCVLEPVSTP